MKLDEDALSAACYDVAKQTLWRRGPVSMDQIQSLAERLRGIAMDFPDFVAGQGRDPNLVVRAIRYMAHVHAIPPMGDDTQWFYEVLHALVEVACPNAVVGADDVAFLDDLARGIAESRNRAIENDHDAGQ